MAKTRVGCDGFHPKVSRFDKGNKRINSGVVGEGGAEWKMATASLHDDVLPDTERILRVRGPLRLCRR